MHIPRCQHIKVNGTQCGSPALRGRRFCYFHACHEAKPARAGSFDFPMLEDANAVQIALMQVIRAIADDRIDSKRASLLLYALQTASFNLKRANLEPELEDLVLDTASLAPEITPPDPVEQLRAFRRTFWKLQDPKLRQLDRDMIASECAPQTADSVPMPPLDGATSADAKAPLG
jgi:hypothetical protein